MTQLIVRLIKVKLKNIMMLMNCIPTKNPRLMYDSMLTVGADNLNTGN